MVKRLFFISLVTLLSLTAVESVTAQSSTSNPAACQAFANIGGVISSHILPMSVKDFAAMNSGRDTSLIEAAVSKLNREMNASDKRALEALGTQNKSLFEEAAVNLAIEIVLSGEGPSPSQVANIMRQDCQSFGANEIINYQKSIYANQQAGQTNSNP